MTLKGILLPDAEGASPNERDLDRRLQELLQADIGALTDSTGGTADNTVAAVSGSGADATINNNFADLVAKVNAIRTALQNAGIME